MIFNTPIFYLFFLLFLADFLGLFGITPDLPTLSWVLPVGISFYTFHSLAPSPRIVRSPRVSY